MTDLRDTKRLWGMGEVLAMSIPASLGMLTPTLVRFIDAWMVSYTGPEALDAQMLGGMASFVPESFATGLLTVVNTYVSQNLGAGRPGRCGQYAWAGIAIALVCCVFVVPLVFYARPLFGLLAWVFGISPGLVDMAAMYFQFMVAAIFLTLTSRPLEQFFYGIQKPRVVLWSTLISNVANLVLGYLLIFGSSGFLVFERFDLTRDTAVWLGRIYPYQGGGLRGAAIAAVICWGLYLAILAANFLRPSFNRRFGTYGMLSTRMSQCLDLLKVGWPAGVQFLADILPWQLMLTILIAPFGEDQLAASAIAMRWMPLSFMPAVGVGVAATALVGRYMGEGRPDLARRRAHAALALALLYMGACAVAFWALREPMVRLFVTVIPTPEISPQQSAHLAGRIVMLGGYVMLCAAVFQLFDAIGIVFIGALRGAGDTLWPMVTVIITSFSITLGGGWLMTRWVPSLGSIGPWFAGSAYVIVLGLALAWRFESGKWRRVNLLGQAGPAVK